MTVYFCLQSLENDFIHEPKLTSEPQGVDTNFSMYD